MESVGFVLLHEKELSDIETIKQKIKEEHGEVNFELKNSKSSGEIFTKFYELHVIK